MTAALVPAPPSKVPISDGTGAVTRNWERWFWAVYTRLGGNIDKVDSAHALAAAAAPASSQVVAVAGLHLGGNIGGNVAVGLYRGIAPAASLPTTGNNEGDQAYALDGRKPGEGAGAGTGVPCFWSAGHWVAFTSGATVTT